MLPVPAQLLLPLRNIAEALSELPVWLPKPLQPGLSNIRNFFKRGDL
jgi:hypothetical protein